MRIERQQCNRRKDGSQVPTEELLAPRTVRHIYVTLRAMMNDAVADEVIASNPCVLKDELPAKRDKDRAWRRTAVFTRTRWRRQREPEAVRFHEDLERIGCGRAASTTARRTFISIARADQSTPPTEGLMAFRLLRYQDRIWERWRADHPKAKTLPMIIPIVMYHGVTPWSEPRSFDALLDVSPGLRPAVEPYLARFTYLLLDLSEISEDELREGAMTALARLVSMCFKHARTRTDFVQILGRWMNVVREVARAPHGLEALAR